MFFSDSFSNSVLTNHLVGDFWVALNTDDPGMDKDDAHACEVIGGAYQRSKVTLALDGDRRVKADDAVLFTSMPDAKVSWFSVWDAEQGGELLFTGMFPDVVEVTEGQGLKIPSTSLKFELLPTADDPGCSPAPPPAGTSVTSTQANIFGNLSYPTGIQAGDLLMAGSFMHRTFSQPVTNNVDWASAGWSEYHNAANGTKLSSRVGYKIADGTESGAAPTFNESASGGVKGVWMLRIPQAVLADQPTWTYVNSATTGTNPTADSPTLASNRLGLVVMVMGDDSRFLDITTVNNGIEITRRDVSEAQLWIGRAPDGTEGAFTYSVNMDQTCERLAHAFTVKGV